MNPTTEEVATKIVSLYLESVDVENRRVHLLGRHGTIYEYLGRLNLQERTDAYVITEIIARLQKVLDPNPNL